MAIAEVLRRQVEAIDAPVLQVDEANLTGNPEDAAWALRADQTMSSTAPAANAPCTSASATTAARASRAASGPACSASSTTCTWTTSSLEFARRGYDELEVFTDLREGIALGIGVVDIKDNEVESPDVIAARIQHAVDLLGEERVKWVHPDCGFWMLPRSVADRKMETLVAGRDLFLGQTAA